MKNLQKAIVSPAILLIILTVASPILAQTTSGTMEPMKTMEGMMAVDAPIIPAVTGYNEGQEILFIHTETSDPKIAKILTDMMGGSPVLVVPSLLKASKDMLAPVYVFTNGMTGDGPMGPLGGQAASSNIHPNLQDTAHYARSTWSHGKTTCRLMS